MIQTDDIKMVVNHDRQGTPAYNTGLAKVAVQCSADTFVVSQSLVLRINICGENRHLRQARKRWWSVHQNELGKRMFHNNNFLNMIKYIELNSEDFKSAIEIVKNRKRQ